MFSRTQCFYSRALLSFSPFCVIVRGPSFPQSRGLGGYSEANIFGSAMRGERAAPLPEPTSQ